MYMTVEEIRIMIHQLENVFDIVKLVDVTMMSQYIINDEGELVKQPYQCYALWKKNGRCENCVSAKAYAMKNKLTKYEYVDHDVYHVMAMYVEVDEVPYMLEMVSRLSDDSLFGTYGKDRFIDLVASFNKKLYIDALTGAYNRQYYEEQLQELPDICAVAMLDVDNFKSINDTYGHMVGDVALQTVVKVITSCVRSEDAVVRYGGDEFLLIFQGIPEAIFPQRLEDIRIAVQNTVLEEYPDLKLSISIGGVWHKGKVTELIEEADALMYQAKKKKNSVQL